MLDALRYADGHTYTCNTGSATTTHAQPHTRAPTQDLPYLRLHGAAPRGRFQPAHHPGEARLSSSFPRADHHPIHLFLFRALRWPHVSQELPIFSPTKAEGTEPWNKLGFVSWPRPYLSNSLVG
jgi:hypothetical protein